MAWQPMRQRFATVRLEEFVLTPTEFIVMVLSVFVKSQKDGGYTINTMAFGRRTAIAYISRHFNYIHIGYISSQITKNVTAHYSR